MHAILVFVLITTLGVFVYRIFRFFQYWHHQNVPCVSALQLVKKIVNHARRTKSFAEIVGGIYKEFPGTRYSGNFSLNIPLLILRDPELIKQITVKDFDNFVDHRKMIEDYIEPLWANNLFQLHGDKWRDMRATLSPAFTSSKMKNMFVFISECAEQFAKHFHDKKEDKMSLEMKDIFTRYANDVIASTAFGIRCDSLKEPNNEFYVMGKDLIDFSGMKFVRMLLFLVMPSLHKIIGGSIFSEIVKKFFRTSVKETMEYRKRENIIRPDMIHLLMEAQKGRLNHEQEDTESVEETGFATVEESNVGKIQKKDKPQLSDDDLIAQAMLFFFAGFDTVSTLMCFMAYELALNPEIQEKLHNEIDETLQECDGKITYETLLKMKYMDMVVSETLRKWPAAPSVDRVCNAPYTIEPKLPGERLVHLEKGVLVWMPIWGIQRDPQYFPDPDKFDPERFSDENKHNIQPFSYLPFGAGPRNCIGSRFALLEGKAVMLHLLSKFSVEPNEKTQIPLTLSKTNFSLTGENGIWLNLVKRIK